MEQPPGSLQGPPVGRREGLSPEERLSSALFSVDAMEASSQRTPRSPKMANPQTGSLLGTRKSASRSNKTSLKTKGRVSNVAGTEADAGIPRRADNEHRVNRRQSWAPRPDLWGDLSAGAPPPPLLRGSGPPPRGLSLFPSLCLSLSPL